MTVEKPAPGGGAPVGASLVRPRCPRCGQGKLYRGYLHIEKSCSACGLDYSTFNVGDGATVFVILIVGAIVAGGALITEVVFKPPYWVHAIVWGPAIVILSLGLLTVLKTFLILQQYKYRAAEARNSKVT